jgi:thiosulfate/3-mercaptopyruvate sulfurtransferase
LIVARGVREDKLVICTCGTGREATNEYLLLKHHLGYPRVRLYEGSFTEWTAYPENAVMTGPDPR